MLGRAGVGRLCVVVFVVVFIAVTTAECLAEETRWWEVVGLGEAFLLTDFGAGHSPESWQAIYLGVDGASTVHILTACVDSKKLVPLMELYVPLDAFSRTATFTLVRDIDKQRFQVTVQPQADGLRVLSVKRSIGPLNEGKLIDSEASQGGEPGKPTSIESASTRKTPGKENTERDEDQMEPSAQDPLEKLIKAPFDYSVLNGTITVTGRVTDEAGVPLKEACVYLIDLENRASGGCKPSGI